MYCIIKISDYWLFYRRRILNAMNVVFFFLSNKMYKKVLNANAAAAVAVSMWLHQRTTAIFISDVAKNKSLESENIKLNEVKNKKKKENVFFAFKREEAKHLYK